MTDEATATATEEKPKKEKKAKTVRIVTRAPKEFKAQIDSEAKKRNLSTMEYLRIVLTRELDRVNHRKLTALD